VLGVDVTATPFAASALSAVPVTIATLPGDAPVADAAADVLAAAGGLLMDVVYGHWPTALSTAWDRTGDRAVSGLGMLLHQAVLQVRVFVNGEVEAELANEPGVVSAMRAALESDA
jgi:shikimate dehydrogenase